MGGLVCSPDVIEVRECRDFGEEAARIAGQGRHPRSLEQLVEGGGTFTPPMCLPTEGEDAIARFLQREFERGFDHFTRYCPPVEQTVVVVGQCPGETPLAASVAGEISCDGAPPVPATTRSAGGVTGDVAQNPGEARVGQNITATAQPVGQAESIAQVSPTGGPAGPHDDDGDDAHDDAHDDGDDDADDDGQSKGRWGLGWLKDRLGLGQDPDPNPESLEATQAPAVSKVHFEVVKAIALRGMPDPSWEPSADVAVDVATETLRAYIPELTQLSRTTIAKRFFQPESRSDLLILAAAKFPKPDVLFYFTHGALPEGMQAQPPAPAAD